MSTSFQTLIQNKNATTAEALAVYDALPVVESDFMLGRWQGAGLPTHHPMDGLLEAFNWYGKEFVDADHVHPLLFKDSRGELYRVNPALMPMKLAGSVPGNKSWPVRKTFALMKPIISTTTSKATLQQITLRGKTSAAMVYDQLPIRDVFRKVDDNTVMGLMDYLDMVPFFFILRRV